MVDSLSLIAGISTSVRDLQSLQPSWDSGPQFAERLQEMKRDLIYLKRELDDARIGIEQLQLMVSTFLVHRKPQSIVTYTPANNQADTRLPQTKAGSSSLHSNNSCSIVYSIHRRFSTWKNASGAMGQWLVWLISIGLFWNEYHRYFASWLLRPW